MKKDGVLNFDTVFFFAFLKKAAQQFEVYSFKTASAQFLKTIFAPSPPSSAATPL